MLSSDAVTITGNGVAYRCVVKNGKIVCNVLYFTSKDEKVSIVNNLTDDDLISVKIDANVKDENGNFVNIDGNWLFDTSSKEGWAGDFGTYNVNGIPHDYSVGVGEYTFLVDQINKDKVFYFDITNGIALAGIDVKVIPEKAMLNINGAIITHDFN